MANAYTPGYHLNQWAAADSFLREEFNNDNRILDETLLGLASRTDLLERQVKPLGLEVYNLMLQHYYEGKETGYRQALAFDGFQDSSFLASVTPAPTMMRPRNRSGFCRMCRIPAPALEWRSVITMGEERILRGSSR